MRTNPTHVSIIMDGNGRWAKSRGLERWAGHSEGVESVRHVLKEAVRQGVRYLSLYAFSEENWNRSEVEVSTLMTLMMKAMRSEINQLNQEGVRFVVLGNRERLSPALNAEIDRSMKLTASNDRITLIVFLSYSGRWDICRAVRSIVAQSVENPEIASSLTPETFSSYLVTADFPDPDLVIRTSGEQRISNYLLWQSAYSEFYFTDVLWPEFREEEFVKALDEYSKRDRRYGKTK